MLAPLPLGYFRIWCQNLVSIQAFHPYEGQMDASPFGIKEEVRETNLLFVLAQHILIQSPQSGSLREHWLL